MDGSWLKVGDKVFRITRVRDRHTVSRAGDCELPLGKDGLVCLQHRTVVTGQFQRPCAPGSYVNGY